jgi:hypothetical protein
MAYYKRTSFKLFLNIYKKIKKNMPAPFRKKKRLQKYP